jgi:ferredoxin--NADP+ reductase
MSHWVSGKVVENRRWSEQLYSLHVDAEIAPFEAGQFTKLGLHINGEIVGRPYSLVNAPDEHPLEFYFIVVREGTLSAHLAGLQPGEEILVAPQPAGFLKLSEVPSARHLYLLSTGTGIGPFLSILKTGTPWQRFERVVLVHAVRTVAELNYRDTIQKFSTAYPHQFSYIPFVSREPFDGALSGRVPQAIADGRLEQRMGINFNAADSHVMLCGNPQMVEDTTNVLVARGLKKHRRRDPGQISVENYW